MTHQQPINLNLQHQPSDLTEIGLTFLKEARGKLAAAVDQTQDDSHWNKLDRQLNKLDCTIEEAQSIPIALRQIEL